MTCLEILITIKKVELGPVVCGIIDYFRNPDDLSIDDGIIQSQYGSPSGFVCRHYHISISLGTVVPFIPDQLNGLDLSVWVEHPLNVGFNQVEMQVGYVNIHNGN